MLLFVSCIVRLNQVNTDITSISEAKVKQMVVVISKMDESGVNWAEKRYTQIVQKLTKVLQVASFTNILTTQTPQQKKLYSNCDKTEMLKLCQNKTKSN